MRGGKEGATLHRLQKYVIMTWSCRNSGWRRKPGTEPHPPSWFPTGCFGLVTLGGASCQSYHPRHASSSQNCLAIASRNPGGSLRIAAFLAATRAVTPGHLDSMSASVDFGNDG